MNGRYKLVGRRPVPVKDPLEWARWFETGDRRVAHTSVGAISVSTVFLGLDHNFLGRGDPLLFETMVFGGPLNLEQERYSTWEDAERGHAAMVARVMAMASDTTSTEGDRE